MKKNKVIAMLMLMVTFVTTSVPAKAISNKAYEGQNEIQEASIDEDKNSYSIGIREGSNLSGMKEVKKEDIVTRHTRSNDGTNEFKYVKNQILFQSKVNVTFEMVKKLVEKDNGTIVGYIDNLGQYQVEYTDCTADILEEKMNKLKKEDILDSDTVSLNLVFSQQNNAIGTEPNDPWTINCNWDEEKPEGYEWGLEAIKALSAWKYESVMNIVNVGVLEIGNFCESEDLEFNDLAKGVDVWGYHANHVAGTIAAIGNNKKGVTGVSPNTRLFKYGNLSSEDPTSNIIDSLNKGITKDKVKVFNYSAGYTYQAGISEDTNRWRIENANNNIGKTLKKLLDGDNYNNKYDFVIAVSAGNLRNDVNPVVSAEYNNAFTLIGAEGFENEYRSVKDRIIVVGAINNAFNGLYNISGYSQLGKRVDIMAPGTNIYSTLNGSNYGSMNGTSMAAPHVTGIAAMLWGLCPELTGKEVKDVIVNGGSDRTVYYNGYGLSASDNKNTYPIANAMNSINLLVSQGKLEKINDLKRIDGWYELNGNKFYYVNGVKEKGWKQLEGNWYYFEGNGAMKTGWFQDRDENWYYFDKDGKMKTDWFQDVDGHWYYLNVKGNGQGPEGSMKIGWYEDVDGHWYYLNKETTKSGPKGSMQTGWIKDTDGYWYYLNEVRSEEEPRGSMKTGWYFDKSYNAWFFLNEAQDDGGYKGTMQIGWKKIADKWYYFQTNGKMQTGSIKIDGKTYYFDISGAWIE